MSILLRKKNFELLPVRQISNSSFDLILKFGIRDEIFYSSFTIFWNFYLHSNFQEWFDFENETIQYGRIKKC